MSTIEALQREIKRLNEVCERLVLGRIRVHVPNQSQVVPVGGLLALDSQSRTTSRR